MHPMQITPERVRTLRTEVARLGAADALDVLAPRARPDARTPDQCEQAYLALEDRWRATSAPDEYALSLAQLDDLCYYAIRADDWHAYRILRCAMYHAELCWQPVPVECLANHVARRAWNLRAARLRAEGTPSLGAAS